MSRFVASVSCLLVAAWASPAWADQVAFQAAEAYGRLPLAFEENVGQADGPVRFLARGRGYDVLLTSTDAVLALRAGSRQHAPTILRIKLRGAHRGRRLRARQPLPGRSHYFIGNDPRRWRTDIPQYSRVELEGVYPGIDMIYRGNQRELEYDFRVAPGADPRLIRLSFEGIERLRLDSSGNLLLTTRYGELLHRKPLLYQRADGGDREPVTGGYAIKGGRQVGFTVGPYDRMRPLVIDPVLSYSTYLGGNGEEVGTGIALDGAGFVHVTGTVGVIGSDVFVAKLNAFGDALLYSVTLGGSGADSASAIAVEADSGNAYVVGTTSSTNFPTVAPLQASLSGPTDAFVAKLNQYGSPLLYSTYLGGSAHENAFSVAVGPAGDAYVVGRTLSANFPTANALQAASGGGFADGFVSRLNAAGSALGFSTYLGGSGNDEASGVTVGPSANVYVAGRTDSPNFPTASALQPALAGVGDAFVAKLTADGTALLYSTYLGGASADGASAIAADAAGNAYVTGYTASTNFPVANALQPLHSFGHDAFVMKIDPAGSSLSYSTYLGGNHTDQGRGIAVDRLGQAYVVGTTQSTDFPRFGAVQVGCSASFVEDAFVTKLSPHGDALRFSTCVGGGSWDQGYAVAVDSSARVHLTGGTQSTDFPTVNALQTSLRGSSDAFVARLGPPPGCGPPVVIDGTFEGGFPWPAWTTQYSTQFGTPLCDIPFCGTGAGTAGPYGGGNWAWFGGTPSVPEVAGLGQSLTFPVSAGLKLRFQMRIGAVTAPATDTLVVSVDGYPLHAFGEPAIPEPAYSPREIDVTAFADGGCHTLLFSYSHPDPGLASFTVDNIEIVNIPEVSVGDVSMAEGNAGVVNAVFTIFLSGPTTQTVMVNYATANGTAVEGSDYTAASGTVTLPPGSTFLVIGVPVIGDRLDEDDETFFVNLTGAVNATIADGQAVGTIVDDDQPPLMSIGDCGMGEGNAGSVPCSFGISLSGPSSRTITVNFATANGTASAGSDYDAASGGLTFTPGQTTKTVDVSVLGDGSVEGDESFFVNLSGLANATVGDAQGEGTILDDDAPSLSSHELVHGVMEMADLAADPGPVADVDWYRLGQDPRASYEVVVDAMSGDIGPGVFVERVASDNATVLQTGAAVGTGSSVSLRWENPVPAKVVGQHIRVKSGECTTDCDVDDVYRIRVYETTYSIPRFNNAGSQITVVLLQNPASYTISGRIYFWDGAGALIYTQPFSIAPKGLFGLNSSGVPALQGKGGTITVSNDGRYGDLAGKAIALEPATGFSFDSPMTPRPR